MGVKGRRGFKENFEGTLIVQCLLQSRFRIPRQPRNDFMQFVLDVREAKLGATQKLVLELIREYPRCTQKYVVNTIAIDQGQVAKAINRLIELGLIVKKGVQLSAQ